MFALAGAESSAQQPFGGAAQADAPPAADSAPPSGPEKLPTLEQMAPRTYEQLLTEPPRDWLVINTGGVLVVEPLVPRPDTVAKIQAQIEAKEQERRRLPAAERFAINDEIAALNLLTVTLADEPESPEYQLPLNRVARIIHHEDHLILAADKLLREGDVPRAMELVIRLQQDTPGWPGVPELAQRVLDADALLRLDREQPEAALVLLEELHGRNPQYPQLGERLGRVVRVLAERALGASDYRQAQFFLARLTKVAPQNPVALELSGQLNQLARARMSEASAAFQSGNPAVAARLADEAVTIWPRAGDLRAPHRQFSDRHQILKVGVLHLPGEATAYPVAAAADLRRERLTRIPLFETSHIKDGTAYYRTRVFDEWEPFDLGRKVRFAVKQFRQPSDLQGVVTSYAVVSELLPRLDPDDPRFDEQLASLVKSVRVLSPQQFEITFARVPPRIEPLLARMDLSPPNEEAGDSAGEHDPGGFRVGEQAPETWRYVRRLPEPDGLPRYHVAEIVERRYDTPDQALRGLNLGEVSVLSDLPDWIVRRMQQDEEFLRSYFVLQYMVPQTHVLQFNPHSAALRVRELRTALAYAIDRDRLLKETVLRDPQALHGRLVTTPFPAGNPGASVQVPQRRFDLSAAFAMGLAAKRQLNNEFPPLTIVVAPGAVPEAVVEQLARVWTRIGLSVNVVRSGDPPPANWDILYRTFEMTEPVVEMWPFLAFADRSRIEDLAPYPDWLKQELVRLDRTNDQSRAIEALQQLHRRLADDAAFIPLWEVDRFLVVRKNCQGIPQRPMHPYDGIDRWTVDAWYQTETF